MRLSPSLGLGFILLVTLSCSQNSESDLTVTMVPPESQILETDGYSCATKLDAITDSDVGPDQEAPTVSYKQMSITWTKSTPLYLQVIKLKFTSDGLNGGEFSCVLGAEEITALFEHGNNPTFEENTIKAAGTYVSNPNCRITCGGISLALADTPEISASGQIIIKATEEDGDNFNRVTATGSIQITP